MDILYVYTVNEIEEDVSFTMTPSIYYDTPRFNIVTHPLAKMLSVEMTSQHIFIKLDNVPSSKEVKYLLLTWKKIPNRTAWVECGLFSQEMIYAEEPSLEWVAFFRSLLWHTFDLQKTLFYYMSEFDVDVRNTLVSSFLKCYPYNGVLVREKEMIKTT